MLLRFQLKQVAEHRKNVLCGWNLKEIKAEHFWPGATCCLNSSGYFHSKIKLVWAHILMIAWWISRILGSWAHFCFVLNLQNDVKLITCSLSSDVSFLMGRDEWGSASAGQKAKKRHAEMAGEKQAGCSCNLYTYTSTALQLQLHVSLCWCFLFSTKQQVSLVSVTNG